MCTLRTRLPWNPALNLAPKRPAARPRSSLSRRRSARTLQSVKWFPLPLGSSEIIPGDHKIFISFGLVIKVFAILLKRCIFLPTIGQKKDMFYYQVGFPTKLREMNLDWLTLIKVIKETFCEIALSRYNEGTFYFIKTISFMYFPTFLFV